MHYRLLFFITVFIAVSCDNTTTQTIKKGGRYQVVLPSYLEEALDLNDDASLQYQDISREFYVIVIDEPKEQLDKSIYDNGLENTYPDDLTGYSQLVTDGMDASVKPDVMPPFRNDTINHLPARQLDFTGRVENNKIYWKLAFLQGKNRYYQIMVWTLAANKEKYDAEMQAIINSFKETDRRGRGR